MIKYEPIYQVKRKAQVKENTDSLFNLQELQENEELIRKRSCENITFSQPILTLDGIGIIFPNTITTIQGQKGVHKSRLTELIAAAFLKRNQGKECLGFRTPPLRRFQILYVDTERNIKDQFPFAIQKIKLNAGIEKTAMPDNLRAISLININRSERYETLNVYLDMLTSETVAGIHTIIILDVITDCVGSFNSVEESMKLIDKINQMINEYDVSFICVIHENPSAFGDSKARGHLGTEVNNKTSQAIQIAFDKGANGKRTDLITLNFLHSRNTAKIESLLLRYCDKEKGLIMADEEFIQSQKNLKVEKATIDELKGWLTENLAAELSRKELVMQLTEAFECGSRIVEDRLKQLTDDEFLDKYKEGREVFYRLNLPF
jgi:hypothetical protein